MRSAYSDIYDCTCFGLLSYPVDEAGEAIADVHTLVCRDCALAYRVDEATGELLPVEDVIGKLRAEVERLIAERAELLAPAEDVDLDNVLGMSATLTALWAAPSYDRTTGDRASAERLAGNLATCAPAMAREIVRLRAERADMIAEQQAALSGLTAERDAARRDAEERRQPKDTRWFVVHQRDGTPMVDIFIEQGAERAAKLTARFYAAQWTDVYVMTGRPVSSADFEAEATEERAERAADKATS